MTAEQPKIVWETHVELGRVALALHFPRRILRIGQVQRSGVLTRTQSERQRSTYVASGGTGAPIVVPGSVRWVFIDDEDAPAGWISGRKGEQTKVGDRVEFLVDPFDGYIGRWKSLDHPTRWYQRW